MKKILLALLVASGTAHGAEAYIYPVRGAKVGQTIKLQFPTVLYLHEKCELPLVNAPNMRKYVSYRGVWDVGCWGQTIDGDAFMVVPKMATTTVPLNTLMRANVSKDWEAKILAGPQYLDR